MIREKELYHYGVKGMKWGIIRKRNNEARKAGERARKETIAKRTDKGLGSFRRVNNAAKSAKKQAIKSSLKSSRASKPQKNYSQDYKESREIKKKHVSEMSNEELKKLNKRMNLEQDYKRLNPNYVQRGLKFAGAVVGATGTILALQNNSERLIKMGRKFING